MNFPPQKAIKELIEGLISLHKKDWFGKNLGHSSWIDEEDSCLQITIGCTGKDTEAWGYQTGCNSFMGDAYGFPIWAVIYIAEDASPEELTEEVFDQLWNYQLEEDLWIGD